MMRGRRTASRPGGAVARLNQKLQNLKVSTNGTKFTPAPNPPDFVEIPWNSYTFERTYANDQDQQTVVTTVSDMITQIRNRLNISETGVAETGNVIKLRILDFQAWATAKIQSTGIPDLKMRVYELNPSDALTARTTLRDIGTLNMPAKLGYRFPTVDSRQILSDADAAVNVASTQAEASGTSVTIRAHVLWKSTFTADP